VALSNNRPLAKACNCSVLADLEGRLKDYHILQTEHVYSYMHILYRSNFYLPDFPAELSSLSFKEL